MATTVGRSRDSTADSPDCYCEIQGVRLRYRDKGAGPAVLLVHGWTLDLEMWEPQVAALARNFRVVRLDRRGHGLSAGLPDTQRDAADLAALCRHLGIERCSLLGMSQGARAVLGFASAAPARVTAVILDGPPAMDPGESDDVPMQEFQALARTCGMAAFRREWSRLPFMQLRTGDARAHALLSAMIERYPGHDLLGLTAAGDAAAIRLERITIPVLILLGAHDSPSRLQTGRALAARLPEAQCLVVADAGHLPNLDQPVRYNELCRAFLARHAAADA